MLSSGADTLIGHANVPYSSIVFRSLIDALREAKERYEYEAVSIEIGKRIVQYYPERSKGEWYAFKVFIPSGSTSLQYIPIEFRIYGKQLSKKANKWPIELIFRSATCWSMPFSELWRATIQILYDLANEPNAIVSEDGELQLQSRVSRLDWALDTDELQFCAEDKDRFLTRARHKASYIDEEQWFESEHDTVEESQTAIYHRGEAFTGFVFGKGMLLVRIYNKWIEVSKNASYKNSKIFFADLWKDEGWDLKQDVWRIECQLRRESLHLFTLDDERSFADASIPEAVEKFPSVLPYMYRSWLSFRNPTEHKNRSLWPLNDTWDGLIERASKQCGVSERRNLPIKFDSASLAKSLLGLLSSFAVSVGEPSSKDLFIYLHKYIGQALQIDDVQWRIEQAIREKAAQNGIQLHQKSESA
ncbi:hypothetical protein NZD89_27045 [Alicyclobacillus fastidiosus]|uniref:Replication initiation factor n=1 Tax=Alicyclobacillus fastidiosus TaxID=392011 RepID=A0ABY6ZIS6_9BACL|nr:hypothetical protein [Alicyclobacillus fastidiosus]WAH41810.1 hypothetical protein NZD89_27010 [Alicyclobacillus fastidiosus]WAH41817.1 hypothetical protein NZD89_27045 [Alicyclobacillus fastidiosus]GMA63508.1 hypothetical protein GCM10025859_39480 [Alicyclobacillus fastidiosus]GMA63515.1 hypothetical protein GCM10025859_39550 [Alicyclobacillus fastidiosus]